MCKLDTCLSYIKKDYATWIYEHMIDFKDLYGMGLDNQKGVLTFFSRIFWSHLTQKRDYWGVGPVGLYTPLFHLLGL